MNATKRAQLQALDQQADNRELLKRLRAVEAERDLAQGAEDAALYKIGELEAERDALTAALGRVDYLVAALRESVEYARGALADAAPE